MESAIRSNRLDGLWATDLEVDVPGMAPMTKAEALAFARTGRMRFERYETSQIKVRTYGDTRSSPGGCREPAPSAIASEPTIGGSRRCTHARRAHGVWCRSTPLSRPRCPDGQFIVKAKQFRHLTAVSLFGRPRPGPVLERQVGHALEFCGVVRDQRKPRGTGVGRDEQIVGPRSSRRAA
jgi:hypothetical protein